MTPRPAGPAGHPCRCVRHARPPTDSTKRADSDHPGHLPHLRPRDTGHGDPGQDDAVAVDVEDPDGGTLTGRLEPPRAGAGAEDVEGASLALPDVDALRDPVGQVQPVVAADGDRDRLRGRLPPSGRPRRRPGLAPKVRGPPPRRTCHVPASRRVRRDQPGGHEAHGMERRPGDEGPSAEALVALGASDHRHVVGHAVGGEPVGAGGERRAVGLVREEPPVRPDDPCRRWSVVAATDRRRSRRRSTPVRHHCTS